MTHTRAAVVVAMVLLSTGSAAAQKRTDVVTLLNGDRITGEILGLERGRLEFKTDDAGTIDIEWDKVATIEAARQVEVATSDGRRLLGRLVPSRSRVVRIVAGDVDEALPMAEVTSLTPIGAGFWARLDGSVDAGFTYTRSSGLAQTTVNSDTVFRRPAFLFRLTSSATLTARGDDDSRDDRAAVELSYVRYRGRRWFVSGAGRLDTNESLGLALRSQLGGMAGVRPVNTNHAQLEIAGGLAANEERGVDTEPITNVEAIVYARTSYYTYDRPRTNLDVSVQYYPSLSSRGRQRLQLDSAVRRELWKDFFAALNLFDSFDSDPPNAGAAHNDIGVVASIGWSY